MNFSNDYSSRYQSNLLNLSLSPQEVNFSIGPFTMTKKREDVVDFTMPYTDEKRGVLVKKEASSSEDAFRIIRPFTVKLWTSLVAVILLVGIVLAVINKLKPDIILNAHEPPDRDDHSLKETLWLIISHYMQQGKLFGTLKHTLRKMN